MTFAAIAVYAVPVIAIASFGLLLSVVTRQSVTAVVGTIFYALALTGLAALPAIKGARPYILVTQLHAWHGLRDADQLGADRTRGLGLGSVRSAAAGGGMDRLPPP